MTILFCELSEINPQHETIEKISSEQRAKDEEGIC